jgi:hypothetical protein
MIPDAPWIRDAEQNGMPSSAPPVCPVCYQETDRFYIANGSNEIIGCENCIDSVDAWDTEHEGTTIIR